MSGFADAVRDAVFSRAAGRCERCGLVSESYEYHHRRPRGMGGSTAADTNTAANCLLLCPTCHRLVESHRAVAVDRGYVVRQGRSPAEVAVWSPHLTVLHATSPRASGWVLLDEDGRVRVTPPCFNPRGGDR